jgi:hypothetical protein
MYVHTPSEMLLMILVVTEPMFFFQSEEHSEVAKVILVHNLKENGLVRFHLICSSED